jgi:hypothetical protein
MLSHFSHRHWRDELVAIKHRLRHAVLSRRSLEIAGGSKLQSGNEANPILNFLRDIAQNSAAPIDPLKRTRAHAAHHDII